MFSLQKFEKYENSEKFKYKFWIFENKFRKVPIFRKKILKNNFWKFRKSKISDMFRNRNEYLNSKKFGIRIGYQYQIPKKFKNILKVSNPIRSVQFSPLVMMVCKSHQHGTHILGGCLFPNRAAFYNFGTYYA